MLCPLRQVDTCCYKLIGRRTAAVLIIRDLDRINRGNEVRKARRSWIVLTERRISYRERTLIKQCIGQVARTGFDHPLKRRLPESTTAGINRTELEKPIELVLVVLAAHPGMCQTPIVVTEPSSGAVQLHQTVTMAKVLLLLFVSQDRAFH